MKLTSRYALLAALGMALVATAPSAPAFAQKKKKDEAAAPQLKLSDAVRKELGPVQQALDKKDLAAAEAGLAKARQVAKTPDENYMVASLALNTAQASGDQAKLSTALDELIVTGEAAGKLTQAQKAQYYWYQGQFAYVAKNYPKAETALSQAIANGSTEVEATALLADAQQRNGKPGEALATLQKVIDAKAAAGQTVPADWFARGADIASRGKLVPEFVRITTAWLAAYPEGQSWHDTLFIYRQMTASSGETDLDLLRLARVVKALPLSAQSNYVDYALAVYLRYPAEAVDVLNEGVANGKLVPAQNQNTREILALSKPKLGPDKASIPSTIAAATGAKGTFKSAMTAGDLVYGYNDYAKAAEMYKLALTKPGANADQANFRLGLALVQAGDKPGAQAAFSAVKAAPYAALAGYGKVWAK